MEHAIVLQAVWQVCDHRRTHGFVSGFCSVPLPEMSKCHSLVALLNIGSGMHVSGLCCVLYTYDTRMNPIQVTWKEIHPEF